MLFLLVGHWVAVLPRGVDPGFVKLPTGVLPKVPVHANSEQVLAIRQTASHQPF
jgi:hypothetical protein